MQISDLKIADQTKLSVLEFKLFSNRAFCRGHVELPQGPTYFPNSYLIVTLGQHLVILAERHEEDDGGDVLKAVNPLSPF